MTELKLVRNATRGLRWLYLTLASALLASIAVALGVLPSTAGDPGEDSLEDYFVSLNGTSQCVASPDSSQFDLTRDFTYESWIYPTTTAVGSVEAMLVNKENSYELAIKSGTFQFAIAGTVDAWNWRPTTIKALANQWQHVALTKQNNTVNLYLNGRLNFSTTNSTWANTNIAPSNGAFNIGCRANSPGSSMLSFFSGRFDEVRLWNVARSESDIARDMHRNNLGAVSGLVGYWDFNEPSGTSVYDRTSNNGDLTLYGSPTRGDVKITSYVENGEILQVFPRTYLPGVGGWRVPQNSGNYKVLVVAGGGGGGGDEGGGGGAGGLLESTLAEKPTSQTVSLVVGMGGLGAKNEAQAASNGQSSQFGAFEAIGGGAGGDARNNSQDVARSGADGGSGGGRAGESSGGVAGQGIAGQGFSGAQSSTTIGNGGGGAGGAASGIDGGAGKPSSLISSTLAAAAGVGEVSGSLVYFSGGGGGGKGNTVAGSSGLGGLGGGSDGNGATTDTGEVIPNSGGGGGGGGGDFAQGSFNIAYSGKSGASGVVLVRYAVSEDLAFTGAGNPDVYSSLTPVPRATSAAFTAEAWVYTDSYMGDWPTIFSGGQALNNEAGRFALKLEYSTGRIYIDVGGSWTLFTTKMPLNQWTHIAVTVPAGTSPELKLYLNGIEAERAVGTGTRATLGSYFVVGSGGQYDRPWLGHIDQVKIWDGELTQAELFTSMEAYQKGSIDNNLRAHYDFNEFNAGIVIDRTGNGSNLSLSSTVTASRFTSSQIIRTGVAYGEQNVVEFRRTYLTAVGGWTPPSGVSRFKALVVGGGGGGGGYDDGGGGGAGGVIDVLSTQIAGPTISVAVGQGGLGGRDEASDLNRGSSGRDSRLNSYIAIGGGGGGGYGYNDAWKTRATGRQGGSSGGNSEHTATIAAVPGLQTTDAVTYANSVEYGNAGGAMERAASQAGSGGGGAGSAGGAVGPSDYRIGGVGGSGLAFNISGSSRFYAGGGGGADRNGEGALGGSLIGGQGAGTNAATAGQVNTGSGGGGSADIGASGGSGVVILSYGPYLEVTRSPITARVGQVFTQSIQVQLTNLDRTLFSSNSPVTVTSSAALILNGVPLTQSLTVNAVNGIATFTGLGFASSVTSTQTLTFTSDAFVGTSVTITPTFYANNLVINSSNTSTGFMFEGEFYASSSAGVSYLNVSDLHANAVANTISISVSGSISVSSAVNISISGRSVTFRAGADIHVGNVNLLTQGPLNFLSDTDGSGSGSFNSDTSSLINSRGGRIFISGGLTPESGYAVGSKNSQWSGARILGDLWSEGGDIVIRGDSGANAVAADVTAPNWTAGVLFGAKTVDAGTGAISVSAVVNRSSETTEEHYGITLGSLDASLDGVLTTTTGGISLRIDSAPASGSSKRGFAFLRGQILSDVGHVTISAVASADARDIAVNTVRASKISTSGSVTLEGRGSGGAYLGSLVLSSPDSIVVRGDKPEINAGFIITSSPEVVIESFGASFPSAVSTANLSVGSFARSFRLGKTSNTAAITLATSMTVSGPISVFGGDITVNSTTALVSSSTSAKLILKATGYVYVDNGSSATARPLLRTTNGDLILWSDSDGNATGKTYVGSYALLDSSGGRSGNNLSGGGRITIAGSYGNSSADSDGHPLGSISLGAVDDYAMVLQANSKVFSGGGDITIRVNSGANYDAFHHNGSSEVNSGTGKISITSTSRSGKQGYLNQGGSLLSASTRSPAIEVRAETSATSAVYAFAQTDLTKMSILSTGDVEVGISLSAVAGSSTGGGYYFTQDIDILSSKGDINLYTNALLFLQSNNTRSIGSAAGTAVTSSSADINITSADFRDDGVTATSKISTSGNVSIVPIGAGYASDATLDFNVEAGDFTWGNATQVSSSTKYIDLQGSVTASGSIMLAGYDVYLIANGDLVSTGEGEAITLKARRHVHLRDGSSTTNFSLVRTNNGAIVLWSDSDGDGNGYGFVGDYVRIDSSGGRTGNGLSGGGRITIAGSYGNASVDADGHPLGAASTTDGSYALILEDYSALYSAGGDITIRTSSGAQHTFAQNLGSSINSGTGQIFIESIARAAYVAWQTQGTSIISAATQSPAIEILAKNTSVSTADWGYAAVTQTDARDLSVVSTGAVDVGISISAIVGSSAGAAMYLTDDIDFLSSQGDINIYSNGRFYFNIAETRSIGAESGSLVTSSSADISLVSAAYYDDGTPSIAKISTSGNVSFMPVGAGYVDNSKLNFNVESADFTYGKAAEVTSSTHQIDLRASVTASGSVVLAANDIYVLGSEDIVATGLGESITFKAKNLIYLRTGTSTNFTKMQTNGGRIVLWSDADANGSGPVLLYEYVSLNSANGDETKSRLTGGADITIGGGADSNGDGSPDGYAANASGYDRAVLIYWGVRLYSGGGDISIKGKSSTTYGILLYSYTEIFSGAGKVTIDGEGTSHGTTFIDDNWSSGQNGPLTIVSHTTQAPAISISGKTAGANPGLRLLGWASTNLITIASTGETGGGISLYGQGGASAGSDLFLLRADVVSRNGGITVSANAKQLALDYGIDDAPNRFGSAANSPYVNTSSANVSILGDTFDFNGSVHSFRTSGDVAILPKTSNHFGGNLDLRFSTDGVRNFTVGRIPVSGDTERDITITGTHTVSGNVSIFGGSIFPNGRLSSTGNGTILLRAMSNVLTPSNATYTSQGGEFTVWADSDNNGSGTARFGDNNTVLTNGGDITIAGGLDDGGANAGITGRVAGDGFPDGFATDTTNTAFRAGVELRSGRNFQTSGGDVFIAARGGGNAGDRYAMFSAGGTTNAGSGVIQIWARMRAGQTTGEYNYAWFAAYDTAQGWSYTTGGRDSWISSAANKTAIDINVDTSNATGAYSSALNASLAVASSFEPAFRIAATGENGGVRIRAVGGTNNAVRGDGMGAPVLLRYTEVLARSGDILIESTISATAALHPGVSFGDTPSDNTNATWKSSDRTYLGSSSVAGSPVTSSSANITVRTNSIDFNDGSAIRRSVVSTSGTLAIEPLATSFRNELSTLGLDAQVANLRIGKSSNTSSILVPSGHPVTVSGTATFIGGSFSNTVTVSAGVGVAIQTDDVSLGVALQSPNGHVQISPRTANRAIDLGTNTSGRLGLSNTEMSLVEASRFRIGSATTGDILLTSNVSLSAAKVGSILLSTPASVVASNGAILTAPNLAIDAGGGVNLPGSNSVSGAVAISASSMVTYSSAVSYSAATVDNVLPVFGIGRAISQTNSPSVQDANEFLAVTFNPPPQVVITDAYNKVLDGNNRTAYTYTVSASVASGSGVVQGLTSSSRVGGLVTFNSLKVNSGVGVYAFTFSAEISPSSNLTVRSIDYNVMAGEPGQLSVVANTTSAVVAQTGLHFSVSVLDAFGNAITAGDHKNISVSASVSGATLVSGGEVRASDSGIATFDSLVLSGSTSNQISVSFSVKFNQLSDGQLVTITSSATAVTLTPGAPSQLVINSDSQTQANRSTLSELVVRVLDSYGNQVLNRSENISVTIGSGSGASLAGSTSSALVTGANSPAVATFSNIALQGQVGSFRLDFTASISGVTSVSHTVTLTPGAASKISLDTQADGARAGIAFTQQPRLTLRDVDNNIVPTSASVSATSVTTLTGTTSVAVTDGYATFSDLAFAANASVKSLKFAVTAPAGFASFSVSQTVTLSAGLPYKLVWSTNFTNQKAGESQSSARNILLRDEWNNLTSQSASISVQIQRVSATDSTQVLATTANVTISPFATSVSPLFAATNVTKVGTFKFKAVASGLVDALSNEFTITNGAPNKLAILQGLPATIRSGLTFSPAVQVQVRDNYDNPVLDKNLSLSATVISGSAISISGQDVELSVGNSIFTLPDLAIEAKASNLQLRFRLNGYYTATSISSSVFAVTFGSAAQLTVSPSALTVANRESLPQLSVSVLDSAGNLVSDSMANVNASVAGLTIDGTTSVYASSGVATFNSLSLSGTVGGYSVSFAATGISSATSSVTLTHGVASSVDLTVSATAKNDQNFSTQPIVRILDADGNLVTTGDQASQTVELLVSPGALTGATSISASGGIATFSGIALSGTVGSHTLTARIYLPSTISDNEVINLGFGNATKLSLETEGSGAASGIALSVQPVLKLRDSSNNIVTGVAHNVVATINPAASLSGALVAVDTTTGTATFAALSLSGTVGSYSLSFSVEGASSSDVASISQIISLTHGAFSKLNMVSQPTSGIAGTTLSPFVVELVDSRGNRVTTGEASSKSVSITAVTFGSVLGTKTGSLSAGVITFDNVAVTEANPNLRITIQAAGVATALTSANMNISAGAATQLKIAYGQPVNKKAGESQAGELAVRLEDQFGNIATATQSVSLAVHVVSATDTSSVSKTLAAQTISPGASNVLIAKNQLVTLKSGSWRIKISSAGLEPAISDAYSISNNAASKFVFVQSVPSSIRSGMTFSPAVKIQILDAYDNPVLDSVTTVSASVVSGGAMSVAGSTSANALGDSFIELPDLAVTALSGTKKLRFSMVSNSLNGSIPALETANFTLTYGLAARLSASATVVSLPNRTDFPDLTLSILDTAGNIVQDNSALIAASASGLAATGTQNRYASLGQTVFDDLVFAGQIGSYDLGFTSPGLESATVSLSITHGAASSLEFLVQQDSRNAQALSDITVKIRDADNNLVTSGQQSSQNVTLAATGAVLSGTAAVSASSGIATFSGIVLTGSVSDEVSLSATIGIPFQIQNIKQFEILPGDPDSLDLTVQASGFANREVFGQAPQVTVRDVSGNVVPSAGMNIRIAVSSASISGSVTSSAESGVATFASDLMIWGLAGAHTLVFTAEGVSSSGVIPVSQTIVLNHGAASELVITRGVADALVDQNFGTQPRVELRDPEGNRVSTSALANASIEVSYSGPGWDSQTKTGVTLLGTTAISLSAGVGEFANLELQGQAGTYSLSYLVVEAPAISTSGAVSLEPGTPTGINVLVQPQDIIAGELFAQTLQAEIIDDFSNRVTRLTSSATLKVSLVSNSQPISQSSDSTEFSANNGLVTFTGLTFTSAGSRYIQFAQGTNSSVSGIASINSATFDVTHAAPDAIVWVTEPATSVANDAVITGQGDSYPRLRANDEFGNLASTAVMTASAAITPTPQVLRNETVSFVGGYATFNNLSMRAVSGSYAISFSGLVSGSTFDSLAHQISVVHGVPTALVATTHPTQVRAGVPFATQPVVEVRDSAGNRVENSTLQVTISAQGAELTGQTQVSAVNGIATFDSVELSGSISATVTLSYAATYGGQQIGVETKTVTLIPGLAASMSLHWSAADIQTRAAINPAPEIKLWDEFGNLVTLDNSTQVVAKLMRLGSVVTTSTQVFTANSGVVDFSGLSFIATPNQGYSLRFESSGLAAVSSSAVAVLPGPVARVEIIDEPGSGAGVTQARTGNALPQQPRIKLVDFDGNIVTTVNSGSITAQIASGLDGTVVSASVTVSAGIAQFSQLGLIGRVATPTQSAEIYTLEFTYQGFTSSPSAQLTLKHDVANKIIQVRDAVGGQAGLDFATQPQVKVVDQFGNTVYDDGAITILAIPEVATGTGQAAVAGNNEAQTDANGIATFDMGISGSVGNTYKLTFKDFNEQLITASQSGIVITPGQARQLYILRAASATDSSSVRTKTGQALLVQPVIEIRDDYGNRVVSSNAIISVSLSSTVRGTRDYLKNYTVSAVAGVATFSGLTMIVQPDTNYQLTYKFGGNTTAFTQTEPLWVTHADAEYITIERQPQGGNKTGNSLSLSPIVTVRDFDGNQTTMISGETVSAVIAQGSGSVAQNADATVVAGVATFNNLTLVALPGEAQRLRFELQGFNNSASSIVKSANSDELTLTFSDAHQLSVIQQPAANAITAELLGTQPKIVVQDRFGNTVSDYVGSVWVEAQVGSRLVDGQDQTLGSISAVVVNGVATFNTVRIEGPANNSYALSFASGALATTTSNAVTLGHTSAAYLVVSSQPVGAVTGQLLANQPQVEIYDRFDNLTDTDNSSQIAVSVFSGVNRPGGQQAEISGSRTVTVQGGVGTFAGLKFTGRVGADYIWQFSDGTRTVNSNTVRVSAAGAYSFEWVQLPEVDRTGELMPTPAVLRALDFDGNLAVSSSDPVTVTVTGGGYIESGTTSSIVEGYVTFSNLILVAPPSVSQQLTFTATTGNQSFAISTQQNLVLRHTTASELRVNQSPTALGQQGASFGSQPKIFLYDRYGNKAIYDNSTVVTATVASGAGGATTGSATVTAAAGEANFSTLGITGSPGVAYTLNYTANLGFSVTDNSALKVFKTSDIQVTYPTVNFSLSATVAPTVAFTDSTENPLVFISTTTNFCTVNSSTGIATIVSAGTCVINVSVADGTYYKQKAIDVNLVINRSLQTPLLMTNPNLADYGQILTLTHSGGSSIEPPTYYATGTCRVFGNQLMFSGDATEGSSASCTVRVIQDGDQNFEDAISPAQRITVKRIGQQPLRIGNSRETAVGDVELFTVGGSGGGSVSYRVELGSGTATCAIVDGNKLRATTNGWCEVSAQKAMSTNYNTASSPVVVFTFSKQVQVVSFTSPAPGMLLPGQSYQLAATASSGLTVSFAVTRGLEVQASQNTSYSPAVCSISQNTVTLIGTGTCEVTATQAGNAQFASATAKLILTVGQLNQVIEFAQPQDLTYGSPANRLTANASSGLPVSYTISSGVTACSVTSNGLLTLNSAGDCSIVATQPGDGRYAAAAPVTRTFKVLPDRASAPALISAAVGNQWFTVGFTEPSYTGGSAIIGYRLEVTDSVSGDRYVNSACATTAPLSCTMVGLPNARSYSAKVAAITAAGIGRFSANTTNLVPTSAEISVTQLKADVSGADLVMNWTPPAVVSGNFVRYDVYVWPTGITPPSSPTTTVSTQSATSVAVDVTSMSGTASISQIVNRVQPVFVSAFNVRSRVVIFGAVNQGPLGFIRLASSQSQVVASSQTAYQVRVVTITDEHSTSQTINTATGEKFGLGAPEAPTQLTIDSTDPTKLIASWGAPGFDGGLPVIDYEVRSNGQVICANITTRMCEISPLEVSTTYRIEVRARNSIGFGGTASAQHTTPTPPPPQLLGGAELASKTPVFTSYSQRVLPLKGATVRVEGTRLRMIESISVAGRSVTFSFVSNSELTLELPALPEGTYDLVLLGEHGRLVIVDAFTFVPYSEKLTRIRGFVDGFLGKSTTLGKRNIDRIDSLFDKVPGADTVRCVASIPTKAKLADIRLAKKRAEKTCSYIERMHPGVKVTRSWIWRDGSEPFSRGQVRLFLTTERLQGGI